MQIKNYFAISIGLSLMLSMCEPLGKQMPQPDLSALKDDIGTLPLSDDYLPAVMQALHYYTEMMQYEQVKNPAISDVVDPTKRPYATTTKRGTTRRPTAQPTWTTRTTARPTTQRPTWSTTRPTPRPTWPTWSASSTQRTTWPSWTSTKRTTARTTTAQRTTQRPTTRWTRPTTRKPFTTRPTNYQDFPFTTQVNIWHNPPTTPRPHKPGNYAPEKPPYWTYFGIPIKPEQGYHKPGVQRPQVGLNALSDPDWNDPAFIQWFFQPKPKEIESFDENELQYLDPLPKKLLLDIYRESDRLPALLDLDNVNEFRKKYDDSYFPRYRNNEPDMQQMRLKMRIQMQQQRPMLTGKKKPPPTRPYVHMLMLYDLLKREAKNKKLHQFGGSTPELVKVLRDTSLYTGDYQMKYLLEAMLARKEVTAADVVTKVNFIISDLNDEKSDTFKTLRMIPPLSFSP